MMQTLEPPSMDYVPYEPSCPLPQEIPQQTIQYIVPQQPFSPHSMEYVHQHYLPSCPVQDDNRQSVSYIPQGSINYIIPQQPYYSPEAQIPTLPEYTPPPQAPSSNDPSIMYQPSPFITVTKTTTLIPAPPTSTAQVVNVNPIPVDTSYISMYMFGLAAVIISLAIWFISILLLISLILILVGQCVLWANYAKYKQSGSPEAVKYAMKSKRAAMIHIILLVVFVCIQVGLVVVVVVGFVILCVLNTCLGIFYRPPGTY